MMLITLPKRGSARERETKLARRRLEVLELAEQLGNVTEACRRSGMDRTRFYDWKRRFEAYGLDGLKDLPPVHKTHPMTSSADVIERVRELALLHPAYGCERLSAILVLEDKRLSSVTVQNILNRQGLGTRQQRWLALEHKIASERTELSTKQIDFLEKLNPCFKERHAESERPGKLISCHTFKVPSLKRGRRIYLHTVVDTYGSYAFGLLSELRDIGITAAVLQEVALPFYTGLGVNVTAIHTNSLRRFSVSEDYKFRRFLALNP